MLNPTRDKNEGKYRGEEGKTPVTTAWLVQKVPERETSYELIWRVKVMIKRVWVLVRLVCEV